MKYTLQRFLTSVIGIAIGLFIGEWLFSKGCNVINSHHHKPDTTITIHNGKADTVIKINK